MPAARKPVEDTVRSMTRKAIESGTLDQAALRRVSSELRKTLQRFERSLARDLRAATRAGRDAAAQGIGATLASSAMAARAASGMLAGIADSLAQKSARRRR